MMYETWLTVEEAMKRTGLSERTLYRRMKDPDNPVRSGYRRIPGRKPLLVLNDEDVQRLEQETIKPTIDAGPNPANFANVTGKAEWGELARVASHWMLKNKPILTLDEAAQVSGYTKAYLKRAIRKGALAVFRDFTLKVHREALRQFVTGDRMARFSLKALKNEERKALPANGAVMTKLEEAHNA